MRVGLLAAVQGYRTVGPSGLHFRASKTPTGFPNPAQRSHASCAPWEGTQRDDSELQRGYPRWMPAVGNPAGFSQITGSYPSLRTTAPLGFNGFRIKFPCPRYSLLSRRHGQFAEDENGPLNSRFIHVTT